MKKITAFTAAATLSATLVSPLIASATPMLPAVPITVPAEPAEPAEPEESAESAESADPDWRDEAPRTDDCPNALVPPQARTTSEVPTDGVTPTVLPQHYDGPCGLIAPEGFVVDESVHASAWLVADIDTGDVIAMKDPHGRYRPASIIKVLLALEAIEGLPLDKKVTVSEETESQIGSSVGLGAGGVYTVEQLLHGLLMGSGNDAAHALAQELGGDKATLKVINELASKLGTTDTRASSYSGLDAAGMQTSAWDMGVIYQHAYSDPTFARIVGTEFIDFPGYGDVEGYELWNDNGLFMNDPDGIGGKTGFTDDANHTFVGAMERDGRRLMAVILDTTVEQGRAWEQAQSLLHEAYHWPAKDAVANLAVSLNDEAPATETITPTPKASAAPDYDSSTGVSVAIAAMVLLATIIVGFVALTFGRKQR